MSFPPPLKSWHLLYKASWISQFTCALFSLSLRVENCKVSFGVFAMFSYVFAILLPAVQGQHFAPAPSPTSDGITVDQGIACFLMLLALVLTYLIHAIDAPLVV